MVRWAYMKRFLAGALFGLYAAHLLYLLNPQVDVTPATLIGVTLVYALIAGLLFGTTLWLLRVARVRLFGKPATNGYRAHGFGFIVFAAFIAATIYWIHLDAVRAYLPIAAVHLLIKATNLITLVAFILLVLWFFERNADRRVSRAIFVTALLAVIVSSVFLYERRDSYRTEKKSVVVANIGTIAGERPVIVVAIRNLPYDWIVQLAGEGSLPFFDAARQRAYFARVEPFATSSDKALWASLATGKLPYRHGVTGSYSYRTPLNRDEPFLLLPSGIGFNVWGLLPPVQRISAPLPSGTALPLWTMFERLSFHAAVVNWPKAQRGSASTVITDAAIRTAPRANVAPFGRKFSGTGNARTRILHGLASDVDAINAMRRIAADRTIGLDIVALDGFSEAQRALHIYANELPPRTSMKGEALRAYVVQLDALLAAIGRDYPDHLLVVTSPCGPAAPPLPVTPYAFAREEFGVDDPGADDGFVVITGIGTTHRDNPAAAKVDDIVPTTLFAAGLPTGRDMDGSVLTQAFDDAFLRRNALSLIATYEAKEIVVRRGGNP
ncbi:MAG TPA: alkaline phosphatase family protein [Thermoanaerobaculia bacterium]|nr:alkaline phosphatase family protein [Thermoanaerobaculia bacterium]